PFVRQIDFVDLFLRRSRGLSLSQFSLLWCNFCNGRLQFRRRSLLWGQLFVRQTCSTLEAAAKFSEPFRAAHIPALGVDLLQLCGKFCGAAVVARAENEIQKFL